MGRVRGSAQGAPGLRVEGVYLALLKHEHDDYHRHGEAAVFDGRERRVTWADKDDHSAGFFLWPRDSLDRLEAGETVVVDRGDVELALWYRDRPPKRLRLPFGRAVRRVRVSPDDRIVPTADPDRDRAVVGSGG